MTNEQTAIRTTYFSIIGNTSLALIKGLAGVFGNSYTLIANIKTQNKIFQTETALVIKSVINNCIVANKQN